MNNNSNNNNHNTMNDSNIPLTHRDTNNIIQNSSNRLLNTYESLGSSFNSERDFNSNKNLFYIKNKNKKIDDIMLFNQKLENDKEINLDKSLFSFNKNNLIKKKIIKNLNYNNNNNNNNNIINNNNSIKENNNNNSKKENNNNNSIKENNSSSNTKRYLKIDNSFRSLISNKSNNSYYSVNSTKNLIDKKTEKKPYLSKTNIVVKKSNFSNSIIEDNDSLKKKKKKKIKFTKTLEPPEKDNNLKLSNISSNNIALKKSLLSNKSLKKVKFDTSISIKKSLSKKTYTYSSNTSSSYDKMQRMEEKHRRLKRVQKLDDNSDDEAESLSDEDNHYSFMISIDNKYLQYYDISFFFIVMIATFFTPFDVAFSDLNTKNFFEVLIQIFYCIDIVISFFTNLNKQITFKENLIDYLTSYFIIDILTIANLGYLTDEKDQFKKLLFRLLRLLCLTKLLQKNRTVDRSVIMLIEKFQISTTIQKCATLLFSFIFVNHICSCLFYYISRLFNNNENTWVYHLNYNDRSNIDLYYISLYWTLTTVTTVGYGNVSAFSSIEKIYSIFVICLGIVIYSFWIGTLSGIISNLNQKRDELNEKLDYIEDIYRNYDIEKSTYVKVKKTLLFNTNKDEIENKVLIEGMPNKIKLELSQVINDKTIKNFHFFAGKPSEFFAEVAPLLKPFCFYQNDYIYHDGETIRNMYFVAKGTVIFVMPKKYDEKEIIMIKKNKNFGEIEMSLEEEIKYSIKIKSKICEVYSLENEQFNQLTINFKDIISELLENSYQIYKLLKYKYYRIIKENRELELKIEKIINKEEKMNNSKVNKININLEKFDNIDDLYNAEDELSTEEKRIKKNKDKKNRRLSENTLQKISILRLKDKENNEIIDNLISLIKKNNMKFPERDNPIKILNEIKKESNNIENIEKIHQIEEMIYNYYSNENNNN